MSKEPKEEPKAGPILSLQQVAEVLKKNIEIGDNDGVQGILKSFEENTTAEDVVNYLSTTDFDSLIELQRKANTKVTIKNEDIDEYVSLSDKIARGLICVGQTVADSIDNANNAVKNITTNTQSVFNETTSRARTFAKCVLGEAQDATENIVNSYKHTKWFLNTVLKNQAEENENNKLSKYIYDKYGYLLVTYDNEKFYFNDAMTSILMSKIKEAAKNSDGIASQIDYEPTAEKIKQNLSSEPVSSSQPVGFKMSPFEDIKNSVSNNNLQTLQRQQTQNNNDTLIPRIILLQNIKQKGIKRSRDDVSYLYDVEEEENKQDPNPNKKQKAGGKIRRKTRRKIRRNKKAKTKKRKTNKKTKKRKMKTKTKRNKRKTNKRRTKK